MARKLSAEHLRDLEPASPKGPGPSLRVLHIEDSKDDQLLFQTACGRANVPLDWYVVESATNGISYLDSLLRPNREHPVHWPDLVLLDLMLPGQTGLAVIKHIRSTPGLARLPVIVLTGHRYPQLIDDAYGLGANSILHKPSTFDQLVDLVGGIYGFWSRARRAEPSP